MLGLCVRTVNNFEPLNIFTKKLQHRYLIRAFLTSIWLPKANFEPLSKRDSLVHTMLITAFLRFRPEGHREPRNEVGSLSLTEHLAGFESGTF